MFRLEYKGKIESFPTKSGGTYEARDCKLSIPATGQEESTRLFDSVVGGLEVGASLRAESQPSGYPKWTPVASGQLVPENNIQQVKNERAFTETSNKEDLRGVMISLAGLMQAHINSGKTNDEAIQLAIEARGMLIVSAMEEISG